MCGCSATISMYFAPHAVKRGCMNNEYVVGMCAWVCVCNDVLYVFAGSVYVCVGMHLQRQKVLLTFLSAAVCIRDRPSLAFDSPSESVLEVRS